jgi:RNA exonuclease 1
MMVDVETTISDVQTHLLTLFNDDTILVGQSLNSDLTAMKLAHPHIIDTSCIYEHPRGRPYKCSLKWLTQRFLKRDIQSSSKVDESGELVGHDSIEDALACLDLLKLKIDKGEGFGKADDNRESIFKRLGRPPHCRRTAIVDHGDPGKYYGAHATSAIACTDDQQVVAGVLRCANGDSTGLDKGPDTGPIPAMDFVWGRFCALEQIRSFQKGENGTGMFDINGPIPTIEKDPPRPELITAVKETVDNIAALHSGLPKCTALVVYSGTGDPRRLRTLHALQKRWKEEYKAKRWSEISVKWTDLEESEMKKGLDEARQGIAFLTVK